jgi:hypothetical protein
MEPLHPSAVDVVRSLAGGAARPASVNAADPYGIEAWQKGAGPMPAPIMGETEGLYSRLDQAIAKLPDQKLPPMKILSTAKNATSGEEIATRGLADFLQAAGGKPVARADVQAHLAANPITLEVKTLGAAQPLKQGVRPIEANSVMTTRDAQQAFEQGHRVHWYRPSDGVRVEVHDAESFAPHSAYAQDVANGVGRWRTGGTPQVITGEELPYEAGLRQAAIAPTKYSQYQVPGGTAYKETLITLPKPGRVANEVQMIRDQRAAGLDDDAIEALLNKNQQGQFLSSHFPDQPNILVHVRSNERTLPSGEHGLFLEEVQSDWHQKGKASGYNVEGAKKDAYVAFYKTPDGQEVPLGHGDTREAALERVDPGWTRIPNLQIQVENRPEPFRHFNGVPDAPFKEQWPDLALKHQLLDAAKRPDLQWLGFTPADVQIKRWGSERLRWEASPKQTDMLGRPAWTATFENQVGGDALQGQGIADMGAEAQARGLNPTDSKLITSEAQLADLMGDKEKAAKAWKRMNASPTGGVYLPRAEGFKFAYDELMPKRLEKIVKPFGGTVEQSPLNATYQRGGETFISPTREGAKAWMVRLTPEMKQRILKEGLPMMTGVAAVAASQQEQK